MISIVCKDIIGNFVLIHVFKYVDFLYICMMLQRVGILC